MEDEQELRERFADYKATAVTASSVLFGSDQRLLDGIKAFEQAGAAQILFAGSVLDGPEQLQRVAALLRL